MQKQIRPTSRAAPLSILGTGSARRAWPDLLAGPERAAVSEVAGADIETLGVERGHRILVITGNCGKVVTIPLAPRTARAIDLAIGERSRGPIFLSADGRRLDRHGAEITKPVAPHTRCGTRSSQPPSTLPCH